MRFYGGSIAEWVKCPAWLAVAFLEAMPALKCEEALRGTSIARVAAAGRIRLADARSFTRTWEREAGKMTPKSKKQKPRKFDPSILGAHGIGFEVVKVKRKKKEGNAR